MNNPGWNIKVITFTGRYFEGDSRKTERHKSFYITDNTATIHSQRVNVKLTPHG
jgi:hypothetical protein